MKTVDFYKHNLDTEEINSVVETMHGTFLTTGPKTKLFEDKFSKYLGVDFTIGMTSWTNSAFLVLKAWGIKEGDEVIVPAATFIASANVVEHCGAKPIFIDSELSTGNIDLDKLESLITNNTKVIMPVHLYGHMVDMKRLRKIANKYNIKILEDCAHCIEGSRDGIQPGQLSDAACFSFYATKNITCGEGGAVVTNDSSLVDKLKLLRLHGMDKSAADRYSGTYKHWDMTELGYKSNMNDIQASMLIPQLNKIDDVLKIKEEICNYYEKSFNDANIEYMKVLPNTISARHLFTILAPEGKRDDLLSFLQEKGIGVAVNFRPVHLMQYYKDKYGYNLGAFPIAEQIGDRTITIPMYPKLLKEEISYVVNSVIEGFKKLND